MGFAGREPNLLHKNRLFGTWSPDPGHSGSGARALRRLPWPAVRVRNKPRMVGVSRQTRLGQLAAEKYETVSAGLMQEYGMCLEKTRKCLPTVARLQAGHSSRASLQADSQTPGSPPCVDADDAVTPAW